jgi:hypothetical protein
MASRLSLSEIAEALDDLADLMATEQVEEFVGQNEGFWRDAATVVRTHVAPRDEDWVVLSPQIVKADMNGEIAGFRPGQMLVNLAYILAQAGLKEVVVALVTAGRTRGLSAFDDDQTVVDKGSNGKGY